MDLKKDYYNLQDLKDLMARLRDRDNGCPWDIEQGFETIKPHTIEEAYEVADAIERDDMNDLKDELGDLLFQVIFHAQMAAEQNLFTMDDVIDHITKKMIFRHPHVFGDETATDAETVKNEVWERQKAKEKEKTARGDSHLLDSVTNALPSLLHSHKIQKKVIKAGFEYHSIDEVFAKMDEEISELKESLQAQDSQGIDEELGDIMFVAALLCYYSKTEKDPETLLRHANLKFIRRFNALENALKGRNISLDMATTDQMRQTWQVIKDVA